MTRSLELLREGEAPSELLPFRRRPGRMTSGPALPEPCRPSEPLPPFRCRLGRSPALPPGERTRTVPTGDAAMAVNRRHRMAPRFLLAGLVFGILGTLAWAQAPAGSAGTAAAAGAAGPAAARRPEGRTLAGDARCGGRAGAGSPEHPAKAEAEVPRRRAHRPSGCMPRTSRRRRSPSVHREIGPSPKAVWTSGYWEWDPDESRFVWVAGSWQVPPAGMVWSSGAGSATPAAGTGSPGPGPAAPTGRRVAANRPAWRINGPPAEHPDDTPPPAPGPDFFYVPGHYAPDRPAIAWPGSPASGRGSARLGLDPRPMGPPPRRLGLPRGPLDPRPGHGRRRARPGAEPPPDTAAMRTSP